MGYFRNGIFRIRESVVDGVVSTVDVSQCYTSIEINPGLVTDEILSSCNIGSREQPVYFSPEATIEFPPDSATLTALLQPGKIIGFEFCMNPFADSGAATLTASLVFIVVRFATVADTSMTNAEKKIQRRRITLKGGDYYPEAVGRTSFPAPYSSAT